MEVKKGIKFFCEEVFVKENPWSGFYVLIIFASQRGTNLNHLR